MTQIEQARYETRKVKDLHTWDDNPSSATEEDFKRLKAQIQNLGVYKPLVINQQDIVLGGNKRLLVLEELGVEEVMCAIVLTDNRAQMIEIGLSDNDMIGVTDEEKVAELATIVPEVRSELFAIHSRPAKLVSQVLQKLGPEDNENNNQESKCRHCPLHCGEDNL